MQKKLKTLDGKNQGFNYSKIVDELSNPESYRTVYHRANHDVPMPSIEKLNTIVEMFKTIIFPGYFGFSELKPETIKYYIGSTLDKVFPLLVKQLQRGLCFSCDGQDHTCSECELQSREKAGILLSRIPHIRHMLGMDAKAAYTGDPAAKSIGETIFSYPSLNAMTNYRIAHELYRLEIPLIPRIITELAHSVTGIDIHPGATIGEHFFIDHGTGTVIGETCEIGNNVRIYQGVTLGAKSFPLDKNGKPIKGIKRHPIVNDNVIIYSGATILGRVIIGEGAEIGGNVWVTTDVPPHTKIIQGQSEEVVFQNGSGI